MATQLEAQYDSQKFYLQSINVMLQMINQLPIENEADLVDVLEAQIASSVLIETKKEVLSDEWDFNRDEAYSMMPDTAGFINVPANILDIYDTTGQNIMRDWRLYNKVSQSALYTEAVDMSIVWDMDFNSLTHPIRNYITVRAARKFQARQVMDTDVYGYTQHDEENAYQIARRSEARTGRHNMLTSGFGTTVGGR